MSVRVSCECGWSGTYRTPGYADYAARKHSCAKWAVKTAASREWATRMAAVDRAPKPCRHKEASHVHGTYACYTLDGCRCEPCATARGEYDRRRTRQTAYGRWSPYVDAAPAAQHVAWLTYHDLGLKTIAARSGVPHGTLWKLVYGVPGRGPSKRIRQSTAERLLALRPTPDALAGGVTVDATGTRRRLQALVAIGWPQSRLGQRLGVDPSNMNALLTRSRVTAATARAVAALYDELWDTPAPQSPGATRARRHAAARGWPPPLAWDDDTIDDPEAVPDVGEAEPRRGGRKLHVDDLEWAVRTGGTWADLPTRFGVRRDAIEQACRRSGRLDLLNLIAANTADRGAA